MHVSKLAKLLALTAFVSPIALSSAQAYDWRVSGSQYEEQSFADRLAKVSNWDVTLGLGMGFYPRYEGSNRTDFSPLPYFDFGFENRLIFFNMQGLGFTPFRGTNYHVGAALGYDLGRFESNSAKELHGLDKIDPSVLVKLFGDYSYGPVTGALETKSAITGDFGDTVTGKIAYRHALMQSWMLTVDTHTTWADREHMRSFFGVKPRAAAASGKPYFSPESGFETFGFTMGAKYALTPAWAVSSTLKTDWLVGDADKSPVSVNGFQPSGNLMVTYSF